VAHTSAQWHELADRRTHQAPSTYSGERVPESPVEFRVGAFGGATIGLAPEIGRVLICGLPLGWLLVGRLPFPEISERRFSLPRGAGGSSSPQQHIWPQASIFL